MDKVKKSSKIGQDQETLISTFALFLAVKFLFLEWKTGL